VPYLEVGNLRLHYRRDGRGQRLLFISGTGGDLRTSPGVFESPLARDFDLLAYDQRGLGQTDQPGGPYTMADYANDAAGLLDGIGWDDALVMGVSFGGMVAQEFALRHPQKVNRLVLACTSAGGAGGASYPLQEFAALPFEERFFRQLSISDVRQTPEWQQANPAAVERMLGWARSAQTLGADDPDRTRGAALQLEARAKHDTWARLAQLDMPVLLCGGRFDGIAPLANMQAMAARIPAAELRIYEGGHLFLMQDRRAYADIVAWFGHA
jgi:3-oxoadipate enol-lactonase